MLFKSGPPDVHSSGLVGHKFPSKIHPNGHRLDRPRKAWSKISTSEAAPNRFTSIEQPLRMRPLRARTRGWNLTGGVCRLGVCLLACANTPQKQKLRL